MQHYPKQEPHLVEQAKAMAEALREAGGDADCLELANCDHLGASLIAGESDGPRAKPAAAWMDRQRARAS